MEFKEVKDSGKRQEFPTGSLRDTQDGKARYDLIPIIPLERLAKHYANGAKKYGEHNWTKGQPLSRYLASCERHLNAIKEGKDDEDHVSAAVFNLFAFLYTLEMCYAEVLPKELNDMEESWERMRKYRGYHQKKETK